MEIEKRSSPNYSKGRKGYIPDMIVCHITEGSYAGAVSWLCNPASKASSHFVIARDGRVTQLVNLNDTAWCNGTSTSPGKTFYGHSKSELVRNRKSNANNYTISIEHEGHFKTHRGALTPRQYKSTLEVITFVKRVVFELYGHVMAIDRSHLVGHCEITPITKPNCPGEEYPFNQLCKDFEEENEKETEKETEKESEEMIETTKIKVDEKEYEMDRIFKNDQNYISLQSLKQAGIEVGYDEINKMPMIILPKKH